STALISPPAAVLLIAPASVLQGAVREHGFTSSPTPETHVRVASAKALVGAARLSATMARTRARRIMRKLIIVPTYRWRGPDRTVEPATDSAAAATPVTVCGRWTRTRARSGA